MLGSRLLHFHRILAEIGKAQIVQNSPAVGVRIGRHAAVSNWGEFSEFSNQRAVLVKELLWLIAPHPLFESA
jgi:hypothetical protein